jgi:23S rRNA-/tRNA-specific pseudouridylate synthase
MTVENDLIHSPRPSHRMRVLERAGNVRGAMHAVTECSPKRHFAGWTLLDVIIRTGVTHQIRCQLAWAGHPLAGDNIYGVESPAYRGRLFLHATRLEFSHPETGEPVAFEAGLPADLAEAMKGLRPR